MSFEAPTQLSDFLDRLESGTFPPKTPEKERRQFWAFRDQVEARFAAGEREFGDAYLTRENLLECSEESADEVVYRHLAMMRRLAEAGDCDGLDLALDACRLTYEGWMRDRELEGRWRGNP